MRLLVCLGICCLTLTVSTGCRKKAPPPPVEQVAEVPKQEAPKPVPKPELKEIKERKGLVYNVYMAAMRPEIQNDMRTVGQLYQAELTAGSAPTTRAQFMDMIKIDRRLVSKFADDKDAIASLEPVYKMNMTGKKLQSTDVLAYEWEASSQNGWCVVLASGQVETNMPLEELKKKLDLK